MRKTGKESVTVEHVTGNGICMDAECRKKRKLAKSFFKKNFSKFKKQEKEKIQEQICVNYATKEMLYHNEPIAETSFFQRTYQTTMLSLYLREKMSFMWQRS